MEDGDFKMDSKEELVEKIASAVNIVGVSNNKKNEALKVASEMLKVAAHQIRDYQGKISELSSKLDSISKENEINKIKEKASKIASDMFEKSLIKKDEVIDKSDELSKLSQESLDVMEKMIGDIPEKKAWESEEYVSDLTFLYGGNNIKEKEKETLSNAISEYINR